MHRSSRAITLTIVAGFAMAIHHPESGRWTFAQPPAAPAQPAAGTPATAKKPEQNRVQSALAELVRFQFENTPLTEVVEYVSATHKVPIQFDARGLDEIGVGKDTAITASLRGISLAAALQHILQPLNLTYQVEDELLLITSTETVDSTLSVRIHPAWDIVKTKASDRPWYEDYDELIELIHRTIRPDSWDGVGGYGSIMAYKGLLVVRQTREVNQQVGDLLTALRKMPRLDEIKDPLKPAAPIPIRRSNPQERKVMAQLGEKTIADFAEAPLEDVVTFLKEYHGIEMVIDRKNLKAAGIEPDAAVTVSIKGISLDRCLRLILDPLDLKHLVRDEVLLITTPEVAQATWTTKIYPIADLLDLRDPAPSAVFDELDALVEFITVTAEPDVWNQSGAAGIATFVPRPALLIHQTSETHQRIEFSLEKLRTARRNKNAPPPMEKPDPARITTEVYELGEVEPKELEELEEVVKRLVAPASWAAEDAYLKVLGNRLIVRQRADVQNDIEQLLQRLGFVAGW